MLCSSLRNRCRQRPSLHPFRLLWLSIFCVATHWVCAQTPNSLAEVVQAQADCLQNPPSTKTYEAWLLRLGRPNTVNLKRFEAWCDEAGRILSVYNDINRSFQPAGFGYKSDVPLSKKNYGYRDTGREKTSKRSRRRRVLKSGSEVDCPATLDWAQRLADSGLTSAERSAQVRTQGECNSCWAMAGTTAMKLAQFVTNANYFLPSVMEAAKCAMKYGKFVCDLDDYKAALDYGQSSGLLADSLIPYDGRFPNPNQTCPAPDFGLSYPRLLIEGWDYVSDSLVATESDLLQAVCQGPVVTAFDASTLVNYTSGIFRGLGCLEDAADSRNHAVAIVGYGIDKKYADGQFDGSYWLVQNSWGPEWGEGGFFRVARGEDYNTCGIKFNPVYVEANAGVSINMPPPSPVAPPVSCTTKYTVQLGDTCYKIWVDFGLDFRTFFSYNANLNCRSLTSGQVVCLSPTSNSLASNPPTSIPQSPPSSSLTTACGGGSSYTTTSGDTCWTLQVMYGVSLTDILKLNPGLLCRMLTPGQVVCLTAPISSSPPKSTFSADSCTQTYTTLASDTCYILQSKLQISITDLLAWNPGFNCRLMKVGQELCIAKAGARRLQILDESPAVDDGLPTDVCVAFVVWQKGDTLPKVAQRNNITKTYLMALNVGLSVGGPLPLEGQRICVGGGEISNGFCSQYHVIQPGDTCWSICNQYQVPMSQLLIYNSPSTFNCSQLYVNQSVCVIGNEQRTATVSYFVLPGDTCDSVVAKNNVTLRDLYTYNQNLDCSQLPVGKYITIGVKVGSRSSKLKPLVECYKNYTVQPGDTCGSVSLKFNLNITDFSIEKLNPNLQCDLDSTVLRFNMVLCVGGFFRQPTVTALPGRRSNVLAFDESCSGMLYTVQLGDYCDKIWRTFNMTQLEFQSANPTLVSCGALVAGQQVCVKSLQ